MSMSEDIESRRLCFRCIGEEFLRDLVKKKGQRTICFYCGLQRRAFSIGEVADLVNSVINEHYQRTAEEPSDYESMLQHEGLSGMWFRDGEPVVEVIESIAQIDNQIAEDIRKVLYRRHHDHERIEMGEEGPFDKDTHYEESRVQDGDLKFEWEYFEKNLETEARYFSKSARATLASIFDGVGDLCTWDGKPAVVECGPGTNITALYRARVFHRDEDLVRAMERPDIEIGPPPPRRATAGRMNARGIAVFYGALDAATAVAEIRPPVGSKALVGRFEILKPLYLLDVEALRSVQVRGSLFDRSFTSRLQKARFLEGLSARISMPVMPDDEPFDYLATQAVADFLATEETPALDGIIYRSVQRGDETLNVVLFHKSARVQSLDIPEGTEFHTTMYMEADGEDAIDCSVMEAVPPPANAVASPSSDDEKHLFTHLPPYPAEYMEHDSREPHLKIDTGSVELHLVKGVQVVTDGRRVARHRFDKTVLVPPRVDIEAPEL
jgi:hypothetical protein